MQDGVVFGCKFGIGTGNQPFDALETPLKASPTVFKIAITGYTILMAGAMCSSGLFVGWSKGEAHVCILLSVGKHEGCFVVVEITGAHGVA